LSTEGYLTPFYDSQPLPFEYAASWTTPHECGLTPLLHS
jgi:hypothetical protein